MTIGALGNERRIAERYQIGEVITDGALSVVHHGRDLALRRAVVVKVVAQEHVAAYRGALEQSAAFSHPSAICTFDAVDDNSQLYIVQEYVASAKPLADYLRQGVPVERAVDLVIQLGQCIAYAHTFEVVHGDITPAAVLIDHMATIHLNNFGLPPDWEYFAASGEAIQADPLLAGVQVAEYEPSTVGDVRALGTILWSLLTVRTKESAAQLREEVPTNLREVISAAVTGSLSVEAIVERLVGVKQAITTSRVAPSEELPPAIAAARAAREQVENDAAWSQQPTAASHFSTPRLTSPHRILRRKAKDSSTGTRVLPPSHHLSNEQALAQGSVIAEEEPDTTIILAHTNEVHPEQEREIFSLGVIILLSLILFILFFLVGFYSIVLH